MDSITQLERPPITHYEDPASFVKDMIRFLKATEKEFSVKTAVKPLRKLSPALVSLVIKKKRKLTLDRADEFAKLLNLNAAERFFFRNWIIKIENGDLYHVRSEDDSPGPKPPMPLLNTRKDVSVHILNDWLNVYVKDFFQLAAVQARPELLHKLLASVAPARRISKALQFLLREGYLRRKLDGTFVLDTPLAVADPKEPNQKIRNFHKNALSIAKLAIDLFPASERLANTLIIPMNHADYQELLDLVQEFAEKLKAFAESRTTSPERVYQITLNLSPVGGKPE